MKITGFETIQLGEFPNLLWVHIHTDEGLVGLGETFFGPRAVEAHIHETVAPLLARQARTADGPACSDIAEPISRLQRLRRGDARSFGGRHRALGPVRPGDRTAAL